MSLGRYPIWLLVSLLALGAALAGHPARCCCAGMVAPAAATDTASHEADRGCCRDTNAPSDGEESPDHPAPCKCPSRCGSSSPSPVLGVASPEWRPDPSPRALASPRDRSLAPIAGRESLIRPPIA